MITSTGSTSHLDVHRYTEHHGEATAPATDLRSQRSRTQRELLATPEDTRLRKLLLQVCSLPEIRAAGKRGVFIGYARPDELFTVELAAALRDAGADVWMDMMDMTYDEDEDWGTEILNALSRCGVMLMIASPGALQDRDLLRERDYFIASGKIVLPVIYDHEPLDLRAYLPPVDLRNYDVGLKTLIRLFASGE